jgi:Ala-tRNA(Pro) deacylase
MALDSTVQDFLQRANVPYSVFRHTPAYTALEEAAVTHTPGRDWAKTVICFADGEPLQAVVPADRTVDLDKLRRLAGAASIRLARRDELTQLFPKCEEGAMPPFGPLYGQRVFVDSTLAAENDIVFNAGTFTEAMCMRYADFAAIAHPIMGEFGRTEV